MTKRNLNHILKRKLWKWLFCLYLYVCVSSFCCYADNRERFDLEEFLYTSPVYSNGELAIEPPAVLEQGGKRYRLVSQKLETVESEGVLTYVSTSIAYELEGNQEPPQSAIATLIDPMTGQEYEREIFLLEINEKKEEWKNDFEFSIKVNQYDADVFFLGDMEISAEDELLDYREQFLHYLGLSQDSYQIDRVEWDGEPYENDGVIYRNATAYGYKKIRFVDAVYGGQIRTPNVPGKQYEAVYEEIQLELETSKATENKLVKEETGHEETVISESEATEENSDVSEGRNNIGDDLLRWFQEHIWITMFGGGFLVCLAGWILLFRLAGKEKMEEKAGD